MNDVNLGKTDDEVTDALNEMMGPLYTMIERTSVTHPRVGEVSQAMQRDMHTALCLDPKKIADEYGRIRQAAIDTGEDAEVLVRCREARDHLVGWQGKAAEAFRGHMDRMESFATDVQHQAILTALQSLAALFGMAYHMRQSYYDLAVMVKAAAEHEIEESEKRADKVKLAIGKEFLKAALGISPGNFKNAAADFVVESVGALAEYGIEGDGADTVIDGYLRGSRSLTDTFESELKQVEHHLWNAHGEQAEMDLEVLKPINQASEGVTDVGSPNFSYANFYTEEYPKDGPFVGQVEEERKKYAEEERKRESEINKRLEDRE